MTTAVMAVVFLAPVIILAAGGAPTGAASLIAAAAILAMAVAFLPAVRFYGLSPLWALSLPAAATLYLLMTWSSAFHPADSALEPLAGGCREPLAGGC